MDEDQKKPNAGDRINQGTDLYQKGRLLNALSKGRLGKGALSAARSAASAARGVGALAATSEIWGPIAIALIIILVPTFLIVLGGQGAASETTSPPFTNEGTIISTNFNSYFCQGASKWQSSSCNLAAYGCSPTSMAMILNSFGTVISPPEVSNRYFDGAGCRGATNVANYIYKLEGLGFTVAPGVVQNGVLNIGQAEKFIKDGYLIIAASGPFRCYPANNCTGPFIEGHEFVIEGVNPSQNTIVIRDPNSCVYGASGDVENSQYNTRPVTYDNFGSFFHAYPIKKI